MALKFNGDLSFKLQVGASHPVKDAVYLLSRRDETWRGKKTDLDAFLANRAFGSVNPQFSYLKLAEIDPRNLEAGMVEVGIRYAGNVSDLLSTTTATDTQVRRTSVTGRYERAIRIFPEADPWQLPYDAVEVADAVKEEISYIPSITFRYAWNGRVYSPKCGALAALELASAAIGAANSFVSLTSAWRLKDGTYPQWVIDRYNVGRRAYEVNNLTNAQFVAGENGTQTTPTTAIINAGISCNPVGNSGWFEVDETWEKSYVAES